MQTAENYRPANIEFDVANSSIVPDNLGYFESAKEATEFIHSKMTAVNQKLTVCRFMDNFEKNEIRKEYSELLETKLPFLEKELQKAAAVYAQAKKEQAEAQEYVNATTNEAKALAVDVKRGLKDISLDDQFSWRVPFESRYFYFTFIDNQIKLCKIADIPEYEKADLWNAMSNNEAFFTGKTETKSIYLQYLKDEITMEEYIEKSAPKTDE
jgi:hypothetical protein